MGYIVPLSFSGVKGFKIALMELWLWEYTDDLGKRRVSRWRMTEAEAARYRDAVKVPGSLEVRKPAEHTSCFLRNQHPANT